MRIILVRHCETDWNAEHRLQGHVDRKLNASGQRQARNLARELELLDLSEIISSDLKRAVQTARIIAGYLGAPVRLDERLRECRFGTFEGLTWPEVEEKFNVKKEYYYCGADLPYDLSPVGGEHRDDVVKRHVELLRELAKRGENRRFLLIGHGTGLNTLLHTLGYPIGLKRGEYREINY